MFVSDMFVCHRVMFILLLQTTKHRSLDPQLWHCFSFTSSTIHSPDTFQMKIHWQISRHKAKSPAWATIAAPYLTHWSQLPCSRLSTHSPCISLATRLEDSNGSQPPCPQSSARAHTAAIFELRPGMQLLSCSQWLNSEAVLLLDPSCSKPLSAIITNFSYVWTAQRSTCTKPAQLDKMHDSTSDMSSDTLSDIIFLTFYLTFYLILYLQ